MTNLAQDIKAGMEEWNKVEAKILEALPSLTPDELYHLTKAALDRRLALPTKKEI